MFEWAREQPEFEINMQNLREEQFRNEDDLEKFAFFQLFEKVKRYFSEYSLILNTCLIISLAIIFTIIFFSNLILAQCRVQG